MWGREGGEEREELLGSVDSLQPNKDLGEERGGRGGGFSLEQMPRGQAAGGRKGSILTVNAMIGWFAV